MVVFATCRDHLVASKISLGIKTKHFSFNFMPTFPLRRVAGEVLQGGLEITHAQQQYHILQFCWIHTKTGLDKVRVVVTAPGHWTPSGPLCRGCSQQDLPANLSWDNLDTRPNQRSWNRSIQGSGSTFSDLRISQMRTLSRGDTPRILRKIPSLPLALAVAFFQSLPKTHDHR